MFKPKTRYHFDDAAIEMGCISKLSETGLDKSGG
jgi:hypothetical protein